MIVEGKRNEEDAIASVVLQQEIGTIGEVDLSDAHRPRGLSGDTSDP